MNPAEFCLMPLGVAVKIMSPAEFCSMLLGIALTIGIAHILIEDRNWYD